MYKICICGHFANGIEAYNGQTIKTQNVYTQLLKKYGNKNVLTIDTYNWKKHPIKLFLKCKNASKKSKNIIILPAHKGFKVFIPLFCFFKKIYKFKLHYIVIGGWLYSFIKKDKYMKKKLLQVDYIYLENNHTISQLKKLGLNNLYKMNNFKDLKVSTYNKEKKSDTLNCCIFSRIEKKKGIDSAINVVNQINQDIDNEKKIILDIYGQISNEYKNIFYKKIESTENVFYKGTVEPKESVNVIEKYDLLLFPTLYYTEGIPGTIIDSLFSGVPILASKWENYDEILKDNITGLSFKFNDEEDFYKKLKMIAENKKIIKKFKENCKKKSEEYTPEKAKKILIKNLGD